MKKVIPLIALTVLMLGIHAAQAVDEDQYALSFRPRPTKGSEPATKGAPGYPPSSGGSHQYEYISSVDIAKVNETSLRLTVRIFLANPTGCTTAKPCPEYDNSPEYVNAWIDWNGDKSWASGERIMTEAGTGYKSISYGGEMVFSRLITVPTGASGETYCRVMLGWAYNPTDPTRASWTWGDVQDVPITLEGKPEIEDIVVTRPTWWGLFQDKNPETGKDTKLEAKIKSVVGYEVVNVAWTGDDLTPKTGNPYTFKYAYGKHGQKNVKATLTYKHTASGITGTHQKSKAFKLFFEKSGDDDGDGTPNWFKYWKKDGASPSLNNSIVTYNASLSGYGQYDPSADKVTISQSAAEEHYATKWSANTRTFGGAKGINCVEEVVKHELRHKWCSDNWKSGGSWVGKTDSDKGVPTASYHDDLPDDFETGQNDGYDTSKTDTFDLENNKSSVYKYYGDQEYYVVVFANGAQGEATKDWANPGKQSDPAYKGTKSESPATPSRSGSVTVDCMPDGQWPNPLTKGGMPEFAYLLGVNSLSAVDTGGGLSYDVLRAELVVVVVTPSYYQTVGWIEDTLGHLIAWSTYAGSLPAGTNMLHLDFDGRIIESLGFDGPYRLKKVEIYVGDEDKNLADSGADLITSAAYLHTEFEAYPAKIIGNASDVVEGGNLKISVDLRIAEAGSYVVSGLLFDSSGQTFIARSDLSGNLGLGTNRMDFVFAGQDLYLSKFTGPLLLQLVEVRHGTNDPMPVVAVATNVHTTAAYSYSQFKTSSISINTSSFSELAADFNSDGIYDGLQVKFSASNSSGATKKVLISAELLSTNGVLIASEAKSVEVPSGGSTWVNLFFLGTDIAGSGINGPYTVSLVTMYDESEGTIMDSLQKAYTTAAYTSAAFTAKLFEVKPGASGAPNDTDGNGLYNSLDVTIPVEVFNPGQITLEGVLLTTNAVIVSHVVTEVFCSAPTNISIVLAFPGGDIRTHGLNGPYVLGDLYVFHSGAPENLTHLLNVFTSGPLLAQSFEGGIVGVENVTDKTTTTFTSWQLDRASGALVGTLALLNKTNSTKFLRDAFWYALVPSTNVMLANPTGTTPDGKPYVDITSLVNAALPSVGNGILQP
jgi:hypothetical protein